MNPPRAPRPRHPPNPRAHAATLPAMMGPHNQARTAAAGECMNCFVDDTALLAGVASRKNQREGLDLRKWFVQGRICLYVPIHTLDRLRYLEKGEKPVNVQAKTALKWLDTITDGRIPNPAVARVRLEDQNECYATWPEVEKFLLPETLLSMEHDTPNDPSNEVTKSLAELYSDDISDGSSGSHGTPEREGRSKTPSSRASLGSSASPALRDSTPFVDKQFKVLSPIGTGRPTHRKTDSNASSIATERAAPASASGGISIPHRMQPLLNHIIWRIQTDCEQNSYVLLTHDKRKATIAQRFGIRVRRLEQLRDSFARQSSENEPAGQRPEQRANGPLKMTILGCSASDTANGQNGPPSSPRNVGLATKEKTHGSENKSKDIAKDGTAEKKEEEEIDSDEDTVLYRPTPKPVRARPVTPVLDPDDFGRGPAVRPSSRGAARGRGGYPPRGFPHANGVFRGRSGQGQSRVASRANAAANPLDITQPIDPDSFNRAPGQGSGRGRRRQLWEPV